MSTAWIFVCFACFFLFGLVSGIKNDSILSGVSGLLNSQHQQKYLSSIFTLYRMNNAGIIEKKSAIQSAN